MVQDAGAQVEPPRSLRDLGIAFPTAGADARRGRKCRARSARLRRWRCVRARLRRGACGAGAPAARGAHRAASKRSHLEIEIECLSDRPPLAFDSFDRN